VGSEKSITKARSHSGILNAGPVVVMLLLSLVSQACATGSAARTFTLDIVHVNDTHSHLGPFEMTLRLNNIATKVQTGGFPGLKSAVDAIRKKEKNVLFLHAGDAVQGTLYFTKYLGRADMDFLNLMGIDAMCPGNHEFDKGPDLLAGLVFMARFPFVSANIDTSANAQLSGRITPYVIKEFGAPAQEKVAIIGVTTPDTPVLSSPGPTLKFEDPEASVSRTVELLKAKGIDKIIVLSHLGYRYDIALAGEVPGIDVIVGGHSHTLLGDRRDFSDIGMTTGGDYPTVIRGPGGAKVLIVQAWKWAAVLGELKVTFDAKGRITRWKGRPTLVLGGSFKQKDASRAYVEVRKGSARYKAILQAVKASGAAAVYPEEPAAERRLAYYSAPLKAFMKEVVARAAGDIKRGENSGPGPLIADGMLWKTRELETRIALLNSGGVRKDLPAGPITLGDVYELLPFDDTLVVMDLSGAEIREALEEGVDFMISRGNGSPYMYVSGVSFSIDEAKPEGRRIGLLKVKGLQGGYEDVDPGAIYRIVTNSFMAGGGDGYTELKNSNGYRLDTGFVDADSFLEYIKYLGTLSNPTEIRIAVKSGESACTDHKDMRLRPSGASVIRQLLKDVKVKSYFCHSGLSGIFLRKDSRQAGVTDCGIRHGSLVMQEAIAVRSVG
jgi:5'-nucleotidase / UDP-sugar diphosphatase